MFESCRGHVNDVLASLVSAYGSEVIVDPNVVDAYTTDWTRRFTGPAIAVLRPKTVDTAKQMFTHLNTLNVVIQIQGGNTGLVGGSIPPPRSSLPVVIVSTSHLKNCDEVDHVSGSITVDAGVTLGELNKIISAHGWAFGVDLAARETATIGGMCATNAGGIRVCAFGMMRENVTGIEFITLDGTVVSTIDKPAKNNTGLQLANFAIGSEGVLGLITRVRLRLRRPAQATTVLVIPANTIPDALAWVREAQQHTNTLLAAEIIDNVTMELVLHTHSLRPLWTSTATYAVLIEFEGDINLFTAPDDALVASNYAEQRELWKYRELASDSWTSLGDVHKLDVSVPLPHLNQFVTELSHVFASHHNVTRGGFFGHLADGNLHIEVVGPTFEDFSIDQEILELVARTGGSVSAEHGIGRAKADFLNLAHDDAALAVMRQIKTVFDPNGRLNPGVIFNE
ncbi:MAG: FAD-binding oxidoreductase [Actinomycetes bacterium]